MRDLLRDDEWLPFGSRRRRQVRSRERNAAQRDLTAHVLRHLAERPADWHTPESVGAALGIEWTDALGSLVQLQRRKQVESAADLMFARGAWAVPTQDSLTYRITEKGSAKAKEAGERG